MNRTYITSILFKSHNRSSLLRILELVGGPFQHSAGYAAQLIHSSGTILNRNTWSIHSLPGASRERLAFY